MTMGNKIVKVYVLKGLNGISLVIENYRVSNEKIYGMLTPIHTFEVLTDDILQAIGQKHNQSDDCVSRAEVIDELNRLGRNAFKDDTDYDNFFAFVDSLPPVTPIHGTCKDCKKCDFEQSDQTYFCKSYGNLVCSSHCCTDFEKRGNKDE